MPKLDEKSVINLAKEYIKKYKLHKGFPEYKFQFIRFSPSPSLYSDEPIWEVAYDAEGWDDLQHSIIISDTEQIALCVSGFQPVWLPKEFQEKEEKLTKREKRLKRKGELPDYKIDSYAFTSKYPCLYVDFNEIISDDCVLLSQNSVKSDFWGNPVLLREGLKVIGYMQDENTGGMRDDLIVSGVCTRNTTDIFLHVRWLLKFDSKIHFISDLEKEDIKI